MTRAKQLILKALVIIALGLAWLSMKPRAAIADECTDNGFCEGACPIDPDLACYETCGLTSGTCTTKVGCVEIWIQCSSS